MSGIVTTITGKVLEAKVASFKDEQGDQINYGKVQLLTPDMSGDFYAIQNIKVKTEKFGLLPSLQEGKGQTFVIECSTNTFGGKVSYYLESFKAAKKAA